MSVTVYGASDDLIEVEGDIREEFTSHGDGWTGGDLLVFSDGTVIRMRYEASGVWRIHPVAGERDHLKIAPAPEGDEGNYSDQATVEGAIAWVVHGTSFKRAR